MDLIRRKPRHPCRLNATEIVSYRIVENDGQCIDIGSKPNRLEDNLSTRMLRQARGYRWFRGRFSCGKVFSGLWISGFGCGLFGGYVRGCIHRLECASNHSLDHALIQGDGGWHVSRCATSQCHQYEKRECQYKTLPHHDPLFPIVMSSKIEMISELSKCTYPAYEIVCCIENLLSCRIAC